MAKVLSKLTANGPVKAVWWHHSDPPAVIMACPAGHLGTLVRQGGSHTVDKNGLVNPSVVCSESTCTFHEWVVLEDWNG